MPNTYDWIERRLGIDIRNTNRVIPELQHLKVGDEIPMPGYTMRVERLDPGRAMVVRSSNHACRFFRSGCGRGPMPRCQRRSNSRAADTRSAP